MILTELAAFFMLICTSQAGSVDEKCYRQAWECFYFYAAESKRDTWHIAEQCSEEVVVNFRLTGSDR